LRSAPVGVVGGVVGLLKGALCGVNLAFSAAGFVVPGDG